MYQRYACFFGDKFICVGGTGEPSSPSGDIRLVLLPREAWLFLTYKEIATGECLKYMCAFIPWVSVSSGKKFCSLAMKFRTHLLPHPPNCNRDYTSYVFF